MLLLIIVQGDINFIQAQSLEVSVLWHKRIVHIRVQSKIAAIQ